MDAPNIPRDEEEGGKLITMSTSEIEELVRREVVASLSLLRQDWLKEETFISHVDAVVDKKISSSNLNMVEEKIEQVEKKMDRKIEDQGQETRQLRSEMDTLISAPNSNLPQNNALFPTTHQTQRSISNMFNRNSTDIMPHDTFSLMMISTPHNKHWWYSVGIFVFQMILCILIAVDQIKQSIGSSIFNVPFHVDTEVRLGQFMSIIFCVAIQSDILVSIQTLASLWKSTRWDKVILPNRDDDADPLSTSQWLLRILFPNLLRLVEGILGLFVSFVVIVQSDNIIDLLRDFTALMIVSEVDNLGFRLAADGYVGEELHLKALKVKDISNIPISSATSTGENQKCNKFVFRPLILASILACMIGGWLRIVVQQVNGDIFSQRFPNCIGVKPDFAKKHFGDGKCYGGNMNTLGCEFEGGDCINFNLEYPLCRGDDLVDVEDELANHICTMPFAIEACGFDNNTCCSLNYTDSATFGDGICDFDKDFGANIKKCEYENGDCLQYNDMYCSRDADCCPLTIVNGTSFQNGICNGGLSATSKCRFDGTDCNNFMNAHPTCPFDILAVRDDSADVILGDRVCDSGVYSIEACGWEFGDCAMGQIGQDLIDFGGITPFYRSNDITSNMNIKMSGDGSMLAVGMPRTDQNGKFKNDDTPGHVQLFRYDSSKKLWMRLDMDLLGDSNGDAFGHSISMSRNGTRLAVGAPDNNGGQVKVFDITSSTSQSSFTQVGQSIYGEYNTDYAGYTIDISADGSRLGLAINRSPGRIGQIRLFDLKDISTLSTSLTGEWVQVAEIHGQNKNEYIGRYALHLSTSKRSVIMFSVHGFYCGAPSLTTKRVYALPTTETDSNMTAFQIGNDIPSPYLPYVLCGRNYFEKIDTTSAMSGDGNRIAIASNVVNPDEPGSVQVLDYNAKTKTYVPIGGVIVSNHDSAVNNGFGYSVAISLDGNVLAISSIKLDQYGYPTVRGGAIEIFAYDPTSKIFRVAFPNPDQTGRINNIMEEENDVRRESSVFGLQLSLADNVDSDGISTSTWLSVRSYNFDTEKGYVKVYNLNEQFYPKCGVEKPSLIRDPQGICNDFPPYNTEECGWGGGDCEPYPVDGYPDCFVHVPGWIGGTHCHNVPPYNTEECGWDDGTCLLEDYPDCKGIQPARIGDGFCDDYGPHNTKECGWDGGDCAYYNTLVGCTVDDSRKIKDGFCDRDPPYNTKECGWDGGDCPTPTPTP